MSSKYAEKIKSTLASEGYRNRLERIHFYYQNVKNEARYRDAFSRSSSARLISPTTRMPPTLAFSKKGARKVASSSRVIFSRRRPPGLGRSASGIPPARMKRRRN